MQRTRAKEQEQPNQSADNRRMSRRQQKAETKKDSYFRRLIARNREMPIRRIFPIWLRIIVIFLLALFALILGMVVGFSVLGDGDNPLDVLTFDFWRHVLDIITGVE